ncbi:MAG: hypothetical protein Q9190_008004 [Brigantiaea leucoxantha]
MSSDRTVNMPRWITRTLGYLTGPLELSHRSAFESSTRQESSITPSSYTVDPQSSPSTGLGKGPAHSSIQSNHGGRPSKVLQALSRRRANKSAQTDAFSVPSTSKATQTYGTPRPYTEAPADVPSMPSFAAPGSAEEDQRMADSVQNDIVQSTEGHDLACMSSPTCDESPSTPSCTRQRSYSIDEGNSLGGLERKGREEERSRDDDLEDQQLDESPPFTNGPARVIMANDGSGDCLALLLTAEMVEKVNQIAIRSRRFEHLQNAHNKALIDEIHHENTLNYKKEELDESSEEKRSAELQLQIQEHEVGLTRARTRTYRLKTEVEILTMNLAYTRDQSQEILETALGEMDLLEPPDLELVELLGDSQTKSNSHQACNDELTATDNQSQSSSMDADSDEVHRKNVREDFEEKRRVMLELEEAFDNRNKNLSEEKLEYRQRVREGTCHYTETEFDLLAVQDFQELTRCFRDAEEAFEASYREARKLKVLNHQDALYQESGFSDWQGGYPLSFENEMAASAPVGKIVRWLDSLPLMDEAEAEDEMEIEREIEVWDGESAAVSGSWSCVDVSRNRRRIDVWRKITRRAR